MIVFAPYFIIFVIKNYDNMSEQMGEIKTLIFPFIVSIYYQLSQFTTSIIKYTFYLY